MEKWVEIRKSCDYKKMSEEFGISPVVARILRNRDLTDPTEIREYLSPGGKFHDPMMLDGMDRVIFVLKDKIDKGLSIRVIGDYDVDGICATFILTRGLKYFGANADYAIPHRIEDGYGINLKLIDAARDAGIDTIITCDNGISAAEQTEYAHSLGITMVITDHHEVPFEEISGERTPKLPKADALVDPHIPGCNYPFPGICGAFVAYKTLLALAREYGKDSEPSFVLLMEELTEFAALATVCDVMELRDENRSLVAKGLRLMEHSKNLGMQTLMQVTEMAGKRLSPYHLGFVIGPCLNASGRLDTPLKALSLFLETDKDKALQKAQELKSLNEERKEMTLSETKKAFEIVDSQDKPEDVLVVYLPECHESLAGIIAGRVREKYNHPCFVITKTQKGLKGSGRSIDEYDMFASLNAENVKCCLDKFGGHKLAAGISLKEENLNEFVRALNENSTLSEEDFYRTVRIDMELPLDYADIKLARELNVLEPYGLGNEKPLFALRSATIISGQRFGKNRNVGKYRVKNEAGRVYEMVYFGDPEELERFVASIYDEKTAEKLHTGENVSVVLGITYQIEVNSYRGMESVSLQIKNYR